MESHRLALREPLHERTEPGERRVEVVHVEAPDGRGDLRIRVVRVLLGGASPEALGGLLVEVSLRDLPLDEQCFVPGVDERRVSARDVLRMQKVVDRDPVAGVAAVRLRLAVGLQRLVREAAAIQRGRVVELDDRILRLLCGERLERAGGPFLQRAFGWAGSCRVA